MDYHIWEIASVFRYASYIIFYIISGQRQGFVFTNNDGIKNLKISK